MKRVLCLLTAILMIFAMTSCATIGGTKLTMYQMYVKANDAMKDADSVRMDMSMDMNITAEGETISMVMSGTVAEIIKSATDIDMEMDMQLEMMDMTMDTKTYYTGGVYYMEMMGQKYKMPMSIEDMMSQTSTEIISFPESAIKNEAITDLEDGKEISFTLDSAALNDELTKQLGSLESVLGDTSSNMSFGDVDLKVVIGKDDTFKSVHMLFTFDMDIEGTIATAECAVDMTNLQIGGVTIDFPDDLDTYVESDLLG